MLRWALAFFISRAHCCGFWFFWNRCSGRRHRKNPVLYFPDFVCGVARRRNDSPRLNSSHTFGTLAEGKSQVRSFDRRMNLLAAGQPP